MLLLTILVSIFSAGMLNLENNIFLITNNTEYLDVCYSKAINHLPTNSYKNYVANNMIQNRIIAFNNPNYQPISRFNTSTFNFLCDYSF